MPRTLNSLLLTQPELQPTKANTKKTRAPGGIRGVYVSGDECERDDARTAGYETVLQHPNEVGTLGGDDVLVLDFDRPLFADHSAVVDVAKRNAEAGVRVGIHTYHPGHPLLDRLKSLPAVTVAKTHFDVRTALGL